MLRGPIKSLTHWTRQVALVLSLETALVQFALTSYSVIHLGGMSDTIPRFSRPSCEPSSHNVCSRRRIEPARWPVSNGLPYLELVFVHFPAPEGSGPGHRLWVGWGVGNRDQSS
jgi:hypothetical protein